MALSTQTVLQDVSAGLALLVDRPFELGDFVSTGGFKGTVTNIGLKSTTLQALSGEVLKAANKEIGGGRVTKYPPTCDRLKTFPLPLDGKAKEKQLEEIVSNINRLLQHLNEEKEGRLKPGFVGVVELTGWSVLLEVNYTLKQSTLRELKTLHAGLLVAVLGVLKGAGVSLVAPPDL